MKMRFSLMFTSTLLLSMAICEIVVIKEDYKKGISKDEAVSNIHTHRFKRQNQLQSQTDNQQRYDNIDDQLTWNHSDLPWNSDNNDRSLRNHDSSQLWNQESDNNKELWDHESDNNNQPWNYESNNNNEPWDHESNDNNQPLPPSSSSPWKSNWERNWYNGEWHDRNQNPSESNNDRSFFNEYNNNEWNPRENSNNHGWNRWSHKRLNEWNSNNYNNNNPNMKRWNNNTNFGWNRWSNRHGQSIRSDGHNEPNNGHFICDCKFINFSKKYDEEDYDNDQYNNPDNEANNLPTKKPSKEMMNPIVKQDYL